VKHVLACMTPHCSRAHQNAREAVAFTAWVVGWTFGSEALLGIPIVTLVVAGLSTLFFARRLT